MAEPTLSGTASGPIRVLRELLLAAFAGRWRRFEIADRSMEPALNPDDWVLGISGATRYRIGDVVVFELPGRPGFLVTKRVAAVDPTDGSLWLQGDNPGVGSVDSGTFGSVPATAIRARLVLRYRPSPWRVVR